MKIEISSIEHSKQRYPTIGDWYYDPVSATLVIKVSHMQDRRHMLLVALHELIEVILCEHRGITQQMVDKFDTQFEEYRHPDNFDEPGDDTQAPYKREHCFATGIERLLASELQVDWKTYEQELDRLFS